jgi:rhamnosyltransferase
MSAVSIIIRTKNEEQWIHYCLTMVFRQEHKDFEVILVDNESSDHTLEIAHRFPVVRTLTIASYRPGLALNKGIRQASGQYVACLSAHCIPQNERWLATLMSAFDDEQVAGVYGRQLPLPYSAPADKRDLLITFGLDRRVQIKDYFFHNANSMIRRDVWERLPFDESATNVEDRLWGKAAVEAGYRLVYEPEAAVYHHHGIHQNQNEQRARSVVSVIEQFEGREAVAELPELLRPEQANVAAVLPVRGEPKQVAGHNLLADLIAQLQANRYIQSVYVLSESEAVAELARQGGAHFLPRPPELRSPERTLEDVLQYALTEIERGENYPDVILYANYLYPFRPANLFDELLEDMRYKGFDTVFPGLSDYLSIWTRQGDDDYTPVGDALKARERKQPLYRSLYGLGCVTATAVIRSGKLIGGRVGILPVEDQLLALKCADPRSDQIAALMLSQPDVTW